eukprot:8831369-Heterocapsa_arctica.AAC.1
MTYSPPRPAPRGSADGEGEPGGVGGPGPGGVMGGSGPGGVMGPGPGCMRPTGVALTLFCSVSASGVEAGAWRRSKT